MTSRENLQNRFGTLSAPTHRRWYERFAGAATENGSESGHRADSKCALPSRLRNGLLVLLAFSGLMAEVLAPAVFASANESLTIGVLLPPEEPQAQSLREGILLAQEQADAGTNGPVRISIVGRVGQWGADAVEAATLVTEHGAAALIAPPDGAASHVVLQVSGRTAVPVVTLCPDDSVGRTGVPWFLRLVPRTDQEATALFKGMFVRNLEGPRRWTALVPDQRAGREISRDLRRASVACDCDLEIFEVNSPTSAEPVCGHALGRKPDAILLWLPPMSAGTLAARLRVLGFGGALAGPGRLQSPAFFQQAGSAAEGVIIAGMARTEADTSRWRAFETAYVRQSGHPPDVMAGLGYDAVTLLVWLLRHEQFRALPHQIPAGCRWAGVSGELRFDSTGSREVQFELLRAHGGRFVAVDH